MRRATFVALFLAFTQIQTAFASNEGGAVIRSGGVPPSSAVAKAAPKTAPKPPPRPRYPQIRSVGTDRWTVERPLVDEWTASFDKINQLGWVEWHENSAGVVDGTRLHTSSKSPLYAAGLRTGDVIHSVNGMPVRNWLQVYTAWRRLRGADRIWVDVERQGQRRTLSYVVS